MISIISGAVSAFARSRLLGWLALGVGGALLPWIGWILQGICNFGKACLQGAFGILSDWKNVLATLVVAGVMTTVGIRMGVYLTQEVAIEALADRDTWQAAHEGLLVAAEAAEQKNKDQFDAAVQAGIAAELAARKGTTTISKGDKSIIQQTAKLGSGPAGAGGPDRVRKPGKRKAAQSANDPVGSFVQSLYTLFGGDQPPKPKRQRVGSGA